MSEEQACPGTCNRRYREAREAYKKALAAYDPLDADQSRPVYNGPQAWPGDPWCGTCKSRITETLAELDILTGMLAATADGHRTAPGGQRVSGTSIQISPSEAGDDLDELVTMLTGWQDSYCKEMGWTILARRGHLAAPETECINWLMKHSRDILRHPDIARPFGDEILQWHREFKDKTRAGVQTRRLPLRCPKCRFLTLTWTEGEAFVICNNPDCNPYHGARIPLAEYEAEVARMSEALEHGEYEVETA